jgi:GT2 family glycosyltransferase
MFEITVIIPTHNRPQMLQRCLLGLVKQEFAHKDFEVIVVDDNSSYDVASSLQANKFLACLNLNVQRLANTKGAAPARNLGVRHAQGKILAFLDDDAIPEAGWLTTIQEFFKTNVEVTAVTGRILPVNEKHPLSRSRQIRYEMRRNKLLKSQGEGKNYFQSKTSKIKYPLVTYLAGGNSAIRTLDFKECGSFNEDFEMMHDRELALKLERKGKILCYFDDMLIEHDHSTALRSSLTKAFFSGSYRRKLKIAYSGKETAAPQTLLRSFADFAAWLYNNPSDVFPIVLASLFEMIHLTGHFWSVFLQKSQPELQESRENQKALLKS